ncbi:hypothetical protein H257_14714 [Aphanomyces astaci]|uniref:Uncharacterized protein n=1 Tax=Aphanomyces astaci TaxID=112090 RepID=W4FQ36_APHAT|nr:hypothetical protein H257_14714 [Aphanomyces astaci]ETV69580.1 hypothetical protein H257_14714 [Aphanomyces astaci]|eukprot:XP_009840907.1 hypothetical protein H257_14714 [Aphanomyces astaci]
MACDKVTSSLVQRLDQVGATYIHPPLDQVNALQINGSRPFVMSISACIDVFTKKRVAFEEDLQDLEVFKKRLTKSIRFGTTILDTDLRIGKML